jgi:hypothetical protein
MSFSHKTWVIVVALMLAVAAGCKEKKAEPVTKEQVARDVNKAVETTGAYIAQQKDAAMVMAKEEYSKLEGQTQEFLSDLKTKSQARWEDVKPQLDEKLNTAKQKLDEMSQAAGTAFDTTKKAFDDAMTDLSDAYQKAKSSESEKPATAGPNSQP